MANAVCAVCGMAFDSSLPECPNCQTAASSAVQSGTRSLGSRLGRWIGWSKWLTAAACLCVLSGPAIAYGFPATVVRAWLPWLLLPLVALHFTMRRFRKHVQSAWQAMQPPKVPALPPDASFAERFGRGVGTTFGIVSTCTLFFLIGSQTQRFRQDQVDLLKRQPSSSDPNETSGKAKPNESAEKSKERLGRAAEDYWKRTIYRMWELRLSWIRKDQLAETIRERAAKETANLVHITASLDTTDVPVDLVEMTQRHFNYQMSVMERIAEIKRSIEKQNPAGKLPTFTVGEAEQLYDQLMDARERGEQLPEKIRLLLDELSVMEDTSIRHLREVKIMQTQLLKRFPKREFALPAELEKMLIEDEHGPSSAP